MREGGGGCCHEKASTLRGGGGYCIISLVWVRHSLMRIIIAVRGRLNQNRSGAHSEMGRVPYLHAVMKIFRGCFDVGPRSDDI